MQLFKEKQKPEAKKSTGNTIQKVMVKPVDDVIEAIEEEQKQKQKVKVKPRSSCGCW